MHLLYADKNFPFPVTTALHIVGYDVLTALEDGGGALKIADELVLEHASQLCRAVLTNNRKDFLRRH